MLLKSRLASGYCISDIIELRVGSFITKIKKWFKVSEAYYVAMKNLKEGESYDLLHDCVA